MQRTEAARGHGVCVTSDGQSRWRKRQAWLTLGALGVVYGDIGTSPLYAVRQSVLATGGQMPMHDAVMGAISLIFWSLIIIVTIKYIVFILRADNKGEGGVLALASLAHRSHRPVAPHESRDRIRRQCSAWRCSSATAC